MEHAQSAVFHCQEELMRAQSQPDFTQRAKAEKMITLAIAYHNLAVELEHTGRQDMCLQVLQPNTHTHIASTLPPPPLPPVTPFFLSL